MRHTSLPIPKLVRPVSPLRAKFAIAFGVIPLPGDRESIVALSQSCRRDVPKSLISAAALMPSPGIQPFPIAKSARFGAASRAPTRGAS